MYANRAISYFVEHMLYRKNIFSRNLIIRNTFGPLCKRRQMEETLDYVQPDDSLGLINCSTINCIRRFHIIQIYVLSEIYIS